MTCSRSKRYDNSFNSWINKKYIVRTSKYFREPKFSEGRVKVELNLSNYVTKVHLKNVTAVDTSEFAKKGDLQSLACNVDK